MTQVTLDYEKLMDSILTESFKKFGLSDKHEWLGILLTIACIDYEVKDQLNTDVMDKIFELKYKEKAKEHIFDKIFSS